MCADICGEIIKYIIIFTLLCNVSGMKKKQEKYIDIKYQELLIQWQQNQQRMHLYFIVLIQ